MERDIYRRERKQSDKERVCCYQCPDKNMYSGEDNKYAEFSIENRTAGGLLITARDLILQ